MDPVPVKIAENSIHLDQTTWPDRLSGVIGEAEVRLDEKDGSSRHRSISACSREFTQFRVTIAEMYVARRCDCDPAAIRL